MREIVGLADTVEFDMTYLQKAGLLTIVCLILATPPGWAVQLKPLSLPQLSQGAGIIFEGECVAIRTGQDAESGFIATWYTFNVLECLKGKTGETVTIKQYGGSDGKITVHAPITSYQVGERVILFLYAQSKIGFTSCVGISQGKFAVREFEDREGRFVTNGMPAKVLFEGLDRVIPTYDSKGIQTQGAERLRSANLDKDNFVSMVRTLVKDQELKTN
ncbi:MAG: hypothetical protein RBU29_14825 [bacterium]|jgi:hypothetical protein|nr:hypothetical protein [bacterium]